MGASLRQQLVEAGWATLLFPLSISAVGILVCLAASFVATDLAPVRSEKSVETVLKVQIGLTTLLMTAATYFLALGSLPAEFTVTVAGTAGAQILEVGWVEPVLP